jgi:hypothetical protein
MDFIPASIDMAGNPSGYGSGRPVSRQATQRELSEPAAKTHAYFSTETYGICANSAAKLHANSPYTELLLSVYG